MVSDRAAIMLWRAKSWRTAKSDACASDKMHPPRSIFVRATQQDNRQGNRQDNYVVNVRVGGNCVEVLRGEVRLAI